MSTEPVLDAAYKWTIDEYVLRCEQASEDLREILVEGQLDRDVITDALHRWGVEDVVVRDAEFIALATETFEGASGVRATLLLLAEALSEASESEAFECTVRVVVDRDYGPDPSAGDFVLVTDWHSMESYAFDPKVLDRFSRLLLGKSPEPGGKGGNEAAEKRAGASGQEIYDRIVNAAIGLGAARLVMRSLEPPAALGESWGRYVKADGSGVLTIDAKRLIENRLISGGRSGEVQVAAGGLVDREREVREDPRSLVRGRDFVGLVSKLFCSPWGRRISKHLGTNSGAALSRQLLICTESVDLDGTGLFSVIRSVFASP